MDALQIKRAKHAAYMREWYRSHPEKAREAHLKYKAKYPERYREKVRQRSRSARLRNPEKCRVASDNWAKRNLPRIAARVRAKRQSNPEKYRTYKREYVRKNRALINDKNKEWRHKNYDRYKSTRDKYLKRSRARRLEVSRKAYKKRMTDPTQRIIAALRARIHQYVFKSSKSQTTLKLLGCSTEDFWIYLESKFETGMTRENHGKVWHLDHIMPCTIFDLSKPEHQKRCFHFSNLQPLFGKDNIRKGAKVLSDQFQLL